MRRISLLFTGIILLFTQVHAQVSWTDVSAEFGRLPDGVKVYKTEDSLNGRPLRAFYAAIPLKSKNIEFTTEVGEGKRYTPEQYYNRSGKPLLVVNGTFFSFSTNQNLNLVMKDGKLVAYNVQAVKKKDSDTFYYPSRSAIGIKGKKADVAWTFTDTADRYPFAFTDEPLIAKGLDPDPTFRKIFPRQRYKKWKMKTAIGGGPVLVHNGNIRITSMEEQRFAGGENDLHPRTAMGYTEDGYLIVMAVEGRHPGVSDGISLTDLAVIMKNIGCYEALNLDGGGSSCMLINGKETIKPSDQTGQRPVPAVFIAKERIR